MVITRTHLIALALTVSVGCGRGKLEVGAPDLRKPGSPAPQHEFAAGDHILVGCRVSGLTLDRRGMYNIEADAELRAPSKSSAGEWETVWSRYGFFHENRAPGSGMTSTRIVGDLLPGVEPGSYKLRIVVRDLESMSSSKVEVDLRMTTPPLPPSTQAQGGNVGSLDPGQLFAAGYAAYQAGDLEGARASFESAMVLAPSFPELNFNLAMVYLGMGNKAAARTYLEAELRRDPEHPGALSRLADLSLEAKDTPAAVSLYERLGKSRPGNFYAFFKLGEIHLSQNRYQDAIESFEKVLTIDPTNQWASINIGSAYYRSGDNAAALRIYERLASSPTALPIVHLNYALALYKSGDVARAWAEALKAQAMGAKVDEAFLAALEKAAS